MELTTAVMKEFGALADQASVERTAQALRDNGMTVVVVGSAAEAQKKVEEIIPAGAEVMDMTSMTLRETGIARAITASGRYDSVRSRLNAMDKKTQWPEMRRKGAVPDWAVGSVQAVTEDGQLFIASWGGSQLPAYAYGAGHVIWVIGTQKIVKNFNAAMQRLYEYVYPLEDQRAMKAYGRHSGIQKLLIVNKEQVPERITVILVQEKLGF